MPQGRSSGRSTTTRRNQSLTSSDGGTVLLNVAGGDNGGTRLFLTDGTQVWYAPNSRVADGGLTLDDEGFLQTRAADGSVLAQLAGPGDHLVVVPGGEVRLCAPDGTVLWRGSRHVIDDGDGVLAASPRTVIPAALESLLNAAATPIVRTDFSDDRAWEIAWRDLTTPREYWDDDVVLDVTPIVSPEFQGWTGEELATLLPHTNREFFLVMDAVTLASPEHPVLVVGIGQEQDRPRSFRATPHAVLDAD